MTVHSVSDDLRLFEDPQSMPQTLPAAPLPTVAEPFLIEVTRSSQRKRSVGARLVGDVLKIAVPSWMSKAEESHWVEVMTARFRRKLATDRVDLVERASTLARRHDLPHAREIRWADNMLNRWGSCTPSTGVIRISSRLAKFPDWVLNYVIVHELAHLEIGSHSDEFWRLVHRYPKSERAIGYLIAKSGEESE